MIEVRMPNLGEGVTEGTIVRWLKAEGDAVGEGETLVEIMTDKVNVEFESPAAGIVRKLHFPEEAIVKVNTVLVPGMSVVTVAFDANNPGLWYVHCHVLWHLVAGMATMVEYQA